LTINSFCQHFDHVPSAVTLHCGTLIAVTICLAAVQIGYLSGQT